MEQDDWLRRRGLRALGALLPLALMLAACARSQGPAPLVNAGEAPPPPPTEVTVQRGQTLSGIAHAYHVPMSVVAEANRLSPPYVIRIGQTLIIPAGAGPPPYGPAVAMTEPTPPPSSYAPPPGPASPPPSTSPPISTQASPPNYPPAASSARPAEPPVALTPPPGNPAASSTPPGAPPEPPRTATLAPTEHAAPPDGSATKPGPAAPGSMAAAESPPPPRTGGTFLWPVRGRVVEGYGSGPDGTHNDGINIAAPRGAAVQATDGGVVAYAGNELRGYGNLVLIKHANGWISAYAHCDLILVKTGQKVARGQVIARVGATGNVSEPQLHFELRRGKRPVDPRGYLTPQSTAANKDAHPS
jgi:murein DD-endopeptidase MepM/ murein hydrolase activator NlpD